jgi:glycosyltransferase involved in cell wall biosynthesis
MRDFVIQLCPEEYHDFVRYLRAIDFQPIVLRTAARQFHTMRQILWQYGWGCLQLLVHLRELRAARTLVVFSHFALLVKLAARFGVIKYERLFCFGFFLHNPRWFRIFRRLVQVDRTNDHYIVFSEPEMELYRRELGIDRERLHFVPLGDWRQTRWLSSRTHEASPGDYYFAGGRSNREYRALVGAFRSLTPKLVIVCSKENLEDLKETSLPANITVECDVPVTVFDRYVREAKAGIVALRYDTGSAGQSVALALMRDGKCILATPAAGLQEYIEDGVSGYWIDDVARDLPGCIRRLEAQPGLAEAMGRAARERYEQRFSLSIASAAFENVLASVRCKAEFAGNQAALPVTE